MVNEVTMQRLSVLRYLYDGAMEESRRSKPFDAISILRFHDSVELFLDLAYDEFGVPAKKTRDFKDYWTELEHHLSGQLAEKRSMDRLNDLRVSFKHHGHLPSTSSIERCRVNVTDFFEENTRLIFGMEFSDISMIYLIQNEDVRKLFAEIDMLIKEEKRWEAIGKISIAFAMLIDNYYEKNETFKHRSLFLFGSSMNNVSSSSMGLKNNKFDDFVKDVTKSVKALQDATKILSLGLDYQRYIKFRLLTPYVVKYMDGRYEYLLGQPSPDVQPSIEKCRFCYDFVVAVAIQLQDINFELEM